MLLVSCHFILCRLTLPFNHPETSKTYAHLYWYDIVHFGPKLSWFCFWALLQNVSYKLNVIHVYICGPYPIHGPARLAFKWKEYVKRKSGLIFEFWKIRPLGGTVLLWSHHLLLFLFLNGENQVRTKNPNDSSMEKKRSAKTRFLGPGIRLAIGKVTHLR